jgi:hypothetical protein
MMASKNTPSDSASEDRELERFFVAEKADARPADAAFLLAVQAGAMARLPGVRSLLPPVGSGKSWARLLLENLGGWRGMAGLAACAIAGLWLGFAAPDSLRLLVGEPGAPEAVSVDDYLAAFDLGDLLVEG